MNYENKDDYWAISSRALCIVEKAALTQEVLFDEALNQIIYEWSESIDKQPVRVEKKVLDSSEIETRLESIDVTLNFILKKLEVMTWDDD